MTSAEPRAGGGRRAGRPASHPPRARRRGGGSHRGPARCWRGCGDVLEERCQRRLERHWLRRPEQGQHAGADPGRNRLQRGDQVGQEPAGVAVTLVKRQPCHGSPAARDPLADQGGLAEAGRGGDQGQPAAGGQAAVQALHEARAGDAALPAGRDEELGGEERRGHGSTVDPGRPGSSRLDAHLASPSRGAGCIRSRGSTLYKRGGHRIGAGDPGGQGRRTRSRRSIRARPLLSWLARL